MRRVARATRNPDKAEDLLHSAFLRLEEYRSRHRVENPTAFPVRVAANLAVDARRREWVRAEISDSVYERIELSDGQPLQDDALVAGARLESSEGGTCGAEAPHP